jgi:hypothetical protein
MADLEVVVPNQTEEAPTSEFLDNFSSARQLVATGTFVSEGNHIVDPNAQNVTLPHRVAEDSPLTGAPWYVPAGTVQGRSMVPVQEETKEDQEAAAAKSEAASAETTRTTTKSTK